MKRPMMASLLATAFLLYAGAAHAVETPFKINCFNPGQTENMLAENFGEYIVAQGVNINGEAIYQLWLNEKEDTWTIVRFDIKGFACIVAGGTGWTPLRVY